MKFETTEPTDIAPLRIIWGARNIARVIGLSESQTHYLLESKGIPGAKKLGGKWCIAESRLREFFELEVA